METKKIEIKKSNAKFYAQVLVLIALLAILLLVSENNAFRIGTVSASSIIPTGAPAIYGDELGVSYDFVSPNNPQQADETIGFLGNIDRTEQLEGGELERYINILYNLSGGISCEYCCGARSVIFENGQPACGCAHSYAMRGVAKNLIKYHGDEYTDEEIFEEVAKWKILFFPGIIQGKADVMEAQGLPTDYVSIASNKYRGIEQGKATGSMVGGC